MPEIPVNSIVGFLGVVSLIIGFFLALAGSQIVKVEKVSVEPGPRTWGFGLGLLAVGAALLIIDASRPPITDAPLTEGSSAHVTRTATPTAEIVLDIQPTPTSPEVTQETIEAAISAASATPIQVGTGVDVGRTYEDPTFGIRVKPGYSVEQIIRPAIIGPTDVAIGPDNSLYI